MRHIESYLHSTRLGVLLELEADDESARENDEFRRLARELTACLFHPNNEWPPRPRGGASGTDNPAPGGAGPSSRGLWCSLAVSRTTYLGREFSRQEARPPFRWTNWTTRSEGTR